MIRFNMPKLRIYQQILICFALIVAVLLGVSFIIHSINQYALKKELGRFTEHTAEALYRDFGTEMNWQKNQSQMMARLFSRDLSKGMSLASATRELLDLDPEINVIGVYDTTGHLIYSNYRKFEAISPELRLPDDLPQGEDGGINVQDFEVIYFNTGNPQDSPYFLRTAKMLPASAGQAVWYVQQKNFKYLQNLVRTNNSLYDAFYIIDGNGTIIAGPSGAERRERISSEDYSEFLRAQPGVTHEYESASQAAQDKTPDTKDKDSDEDRSLKKVVVKMPDINWGIIIESPYHVKQKFIQRANTNTLLLVLGTLLLLLLLVVPYILGISRNFRQLIKGVKAMGEGNYYRRIRLLTNFYTPYEIVYLTLEFNRMARKTAESWQTIQEANRKLAKLDEFKSNLIDTVSHELRTPLTSIKGYTSRLIRYDSTLDQDARIKSLKVVKQQADRLSRMVEDLLVIPDLETSSLRVYPDQVALSPLIDNAVHSILAKEAREIIVSVSPDLDESPSVLADPDRLEQILLNLLDNAVKYSLPETPIEVQVRPDAEDSSDEESENRDAPDTAEPAPGKIAISVINICDPIPMEKLDEPDSLFEKFKRLDDSLIRTTRGSGLGLFITRGLVEAMGGEIRLFYEDGHFSVRFTIPLYPAASETQTEPLVV